METQARHVVVDPPPVIGQDGAQNVVLIEDARAPAMQHYSSYQLPKGSSAGSHRDPDEYTCAYTMEFTGSVGPGQSTVIMGCST